MMTALIVIVEAPTTPVPDKSYAPRSSVVAILVPTAVTLIVSKTSLFVSKSASAVAVAVKFKTSDVPADPVTFVSVCISPGLALTVN